MPSADVQGKFLWHELTTGDPGASGAFYGRVLGWTPQAWDKDPSYTVLLTPKGPVGGMMRPDPGAQDGNASAQWIAYIGVANVDETAAAAERLGGRIVKGAVDIAGGGGRYAVLADPQGGLFGVLASPASGATGHASDVFSWHELATPDHAAAFRFYRELFGWEQLGVHDMGAMGPYLLFGRGGQQFGGMFNRPSSTASSAPHWLSYVRVGSAVRAAETARAAGGRVINGPHQVPGGSWVAQIADPHGAAIAVNQPQAAPEAVAASKPAVSAAAPRPAATAAVSRPATAPAAPGPAAGGASSPASIRPAAPTVKPAAVPATAGSTGASTGAGKTAQPVAKPPASGASAPARPAATPRKPAPARKAPARKKAAARTATGRRAAGAGRAAARTGSARTARKSSAAKKRPAAKKKGSASRRSTSRPTAAPRKRAAKRSAAGTARRRAAAKATRKAAGRKAAAKKTGRKQAVRRRARR